MTDSFALRRPSSGGDSYMSPVVVLGRLASTWSQRPNDTSLGASGRKPRAARWVRWLRWLRWARWLLIIAVLYVYAHMRFLSPHFPGLLPIVCDGKHRPVRRWPLFGRTRPFTSWGDTWKSVKISRFQIDASLTDYFALRRARCSGDSYTSPIVVVGRLTSTWSQRPNDTSLGASGRKPRAARWVRWLRWLRWARWLLIIAVSYVYAHMLFLSPHLPGLLPIVCDGQNRPVR